MAARKKTGRWIIIILFILAAFAGWRLFGSNTNFEENRKSFYIKTGSTFDDVIRSIDTQHLIKNPKTFEWVAKQLGYDEKVKAGKYVIQRGSSIFAIVRTLRSGKQTPVNLVINKL